MDSTTPFTLTGDRYDQSTYWGRMMKMLHICDPSMLLFSRNHINEAVGKLWHFEQFGNVEKITDADLWHYRKLKESAVHPDTGEIIPLPFRMSGYVPFNGPVSVGLIMATRTPWILFWQWMNQSQNALVNYFNRNATSVASDSVVAASYAGAVTSAMSVGYGLSQVVKRFYSPEKALTLLKFIALPTSIVASSVNCMIMRWPETKTGIKVYDSERREVGSSVVAAKKAIQETVFPHATSAPCVCVPTCDDDAAPSSKIFKAQSATHHTSDDGVALFGVRIWIAGQYSSVPTARCN